MRDCRYSSTILDLGTWIEVWASEPVWTLWRPEKSLASAGNQNPAVQPVARRYTDRAMAASLQITACIIIYLFTCGLFNNADSIWVNISSDDSITKESEACGRKGSRTYMRYLPTHPPTYLYSCCSHLEHKASVKRFVSLQFLNFRQSVGLLGLGISPSQGRYLHRTTQTQNKRRQTPIPWVLFEPTIPMFKRAKTFHASDRAASVIGWDLSIGAAKTTKRTAGLGVKLYSRELLNSAIKTCDILANPECAVVLQIRHLSQGKRVG
jgi:hypothetical protein